MFFEAIVEGPLAVFDEESKGNSTRGIGRKRNDFALVGIPGPRGIGPGKQLGRHGRPDIDTAF